MRLGRKICAVVACAIVAVGLRAAVASMAWRRPPGVLIFQDRAARREYPGSHPIAAGFFKAADRMSYPRKEDPNLPAYQDFCNRVLAIRTGAILADFPFEALARGFLCPNGSCDLNPLLRKWADTGVGGLDALEEVWPQGDKKSIPLKLIAVFPRFDLATVVGESPDERMEGAELRFIYAAAPSRFRLILEYQLPGLPAAEFYDLLRKWTDSAPDIVRHTLERSSGPRVRTLGAHGGNVWHFGQFGSNLERQDPDRQFRKGLCAASGSPLSRFLALPGVPDQVRASDYDLRPIAELQAPQGDLDDAETAVLSVSRKAAPVGENDAGIDQLRFLLSINSCTGCHGQEAQSDDPGVAQLFFDSTQPARLSRFLTGCPDRDGYCKPHDDPQEYLWMPKTAPDPNCADCPPIQQKGFNDLLRRSRYWRVILDRSIPISSWKERLAPFAAFQPM